MAVSVIPESSDVGDNAFSRHPSAVAIFHKLISTQNLKGASLGTSKPAEDPTACTVSKPESSFAGPEDLPTEILLSIFQYAFESSVDWPKTGALSSEHPTVWLEDDPLSPYLFPYSLASVCVRWLHTLSSIPAYWTRQVVIVDSHATSPTATQMLLRWVGDIPLQLIVTRHPDSSGQTDRDEHARVRDVLDLVRPHIRHTWSLAFNVKFSSSLPAIWREQGDAPCLRSLTLTSSPSEIGGIADLPRLPELRSGRRYWYKTPFEARSLKGVTFGGHFLNDILAFWKQHNHWFRNITSLTIRGYAAPDGGGISLHKFVSSVQTCTLLEEMVVEDTAFVNDVHASYRFRIEAPVVHLRKVTDDAAFGTLISQTLGMRLKQVVTISGCPFDNFGTRNLFRTNLTSIDLVLEGMDASCAAIEKLVCFWNGENLSLIDCPELTGSFMRNVPMEQTPARLRRLRIMDCQNVTAEGLIYWARSRMNHLGITPIIPGDIDMEPHQLLIELRVQGRGPPITLEQALWFAEHVESFSWDTITSDGTRYCWDAFARELTVFPTNL